MSHQMSSNSLVYIALTFLLAMSDSQSLQAQQEPKKPPEKVVVSGPESLVCIDADTANTFPALPCIHESATKKCMAPQGRTGTGEEWYTIFGFDGYLHQLPGGELKMHVFARYQTTVRAKNNPITTYKFSWDNDVIYEFTLPSLPLNSQSPHRGYAKACEWQWRIPNKNLFGPQASGALSIGSFGRSDR
ncbi:MAG: hypothetical protein ACRCS9_16300 [Hyphomicrobium sp.]